MFSATTENIYGLGWSERKGYWREERLCVRGEEIQDTRDGRD